jgi:hypothetical protein
VVSQLGEELTGWWDAYALHPIYGVVEQELRRLSG